MGLCKCAAACVLAYLVGMSLGTRTHLLHPPHAWAPALKGEPLGLQ